jgi:hypothetical protein
MSDKTPLQIAIQTAYEEIFGETTIPLNVGGIDIPTRPDELTERQLVAFLRYGKRGANDAYNTDAKKARDEGKPAPEPKAYFAEWLESWGTNKPRGGGGRSLSVEVAGWIAYYKSKGSVAKLKGTIPNGANIDEFHTIFVKRAIWPSIRAHLSTMSESDQRNWIKTKLPEVIETHKETVLKQAEADTRPNQPGDFIAIERKIREGTTIDNTFTVSIQL